MIAKCNSPERSNERKIVKINAACNRNCGACRSDSFERSENESTGRSSNPGFPDRSRKHVYLNWDAAEPLDMAAGVCERSKEK
jgi:hypothetical protein